LNSNKGKALVLALDKSGSMSGIPIKAAIDGALKLAETIYEGNYFEQFIALFYESKITEYNCKTYEEFKNKVGREYASGGTNFICVFDYITNLVRKNLGTKTAIHEISIIFFTDGQDNSEQHRLELSM
jgi:uncharacterized protein with von Willebrand factor type A (vWA) domain